VHCVGACMYSMSAHISIRVATCVRMGLCGENEKVRQLGEGVEGKKWELWHEEIQFQEERKSYVEKCGSVEAL
jgi:hypothetical protein